MDNNLQKSRKMENQTSSSFLDGLQSIGAKIGHQHCKLDKMQDVVL